MTRRYEGFAYPSVLLVLDTFTGEVCTVPVPGEVPLRLAQAVADAPMVPPAVAEAAAAAAATAGSAATVQGSPSTGAPDELPGDVDPFDREVALTFPYPVARAWAALLREPDPRMQCKLLVDTFTAALKMLALQVASEYLHADGVRSARVNQTLARDLRRPLISAWNLVLQRTLPALRDARVELFAPEVEAAYRTLEVKCRKRFLVTTHYVDAGGENRTRTKKLGKIQALISYRNSLAHGFNQSRERARREVDTYLPLLREILQETRFLARYELWHVRTREGVPEGMRLHGSNPTGGFTPIDPVDLDPTISPLFLRHPSTGVTLPLFAFFDVDDVEEGGLPGMGKDVLLFEGNTKRTVIYVSASGEHVEKASRLAHWRTLLERKALDVSLLTADTLTREALAAATGRVSAGSLDALIQSGKYLREATIDRVSLADTLAQFEAGTRTGLVVGGASGIGKSSFIARCVDRWQAEGHPVAFYRASALSEPDVSQRLLRDLGVSTGMPYLEEFLSAATPLFEDTGHRFILVVDAVNEFPGDVASLVRELDALVHQAKAHPWFRVVASVRDGTQRRLPPDARFGTRGLGPYVTVEEVVDGQTQPVPVAKLKAVTDEEVAELYEAYRQYRVTDPDDPEDPGVARFCPQTDFDALDPMGHTRALLREPLMARLVMAAHHRRALPGNLRVDAAMKLYIDTAVVESGTPGGGFPNRLRFLQRLVKELDRADIDSLPRDALAAMPALRPLFGSFQRDSAYIQLLDLGVLLEEWRDDECYVRFAFDRMLEFLLAERIDPRIQASADLLALAERAGRFASLRGVLGVILGRACDQGRAHLVTELLDATAEAGVAPETASLVSAAVTDLVVRLGVDRAPGFEPLLAALQETPSAADVQMLCTAADRLFLLGVVNQLDLVLAALDAESKTLGEPGPRARAALRLGLRAEKLREYKRAKSLKEEALRCAEEADLPDIQATAIREIGWICYQLDENAEATALTTRALAMFETLEHSRGIAKSYNDLGIFAKERGEQEEAVRLYRAAVAINEANSYLEDLSDNYFNLASVAESRSDDTESARLFRVSVEIDQGLGRASSVGSGQWRLAKIASRAENYAEAERLCLSSLAIHERTENHKKQGTELSRLGNICFKAGDLERSNQYFQRAIALHTRLDNQRGLSFTYYYLARNASEGGDSDEATRLYEKSLAIDEALGDLEGARTLHTRLATLAEKQKDWAREAHHLQKAVELAVELEDKKTEARLRSHLGTNAKSSGDYDLAKQHYTHALELDTARNYKKGISMRNYYLGKLAKLRHHDDEAMACFERSLHIDLALDDRKGAATMHALVGQQAVRLRDLAKARDHYQASLALREAIGAKELVANTRYKLACLDFLEGKKEAARATWEQVLTEATEQSWSDLALKVLSKQVFLPDELPANLSERIEALGAEVDTPLGEVGVAVVRAGIEARQDADLERLDRHLDALRKAVATLREPPAIEESEAAALWWAAQAFDRAGDTVQARALATEVRDVVRGRGWPYSADLEAFLNRPQSTT